MEVLVAAVQEPTRSFSETKRVETNRVQVFGQVRQNLAAQGGNQNIVLDANTAPIGKVDSWLDSHDHTRLQDVLGLLTQPGRLVNIHAQSVADTMFKITTESCLLDDRAGLGIDVMGLRPGGSPRLLVPEPAGQFGRLFQILE